MTEPFTAVGIGDMSGDVFGNGMLLSQQIRLVAAFDHRHVFLDPTPDPAAAFAERRAAVRRCTGTSWDDYDRSVISAGRRRVAADGEVGAALARRPGRRSASTAERCRRPS